MVIGAFPTLHDDELLYSGIGRFARMFDVPSTMALGQHVWGTRTATSTLDLPGRLGVFVSRLPAPAPWTPDDLILRHTTFPYYARFVTPERRRRAREVMIHGTGRGVHSRLGARQFPEAYPEALRFCLDCYAADRERGGAGYWHRAHQLPGVYVCARHRRPLQMVRIGPGEPRWSYRVLDEREVARARPAPVPHAKIEVLLALAERTDWLLSMPVADLEPAELHARYRSLARARGWITPNRRIAIEELDRAALERYGANLLEATSCGIAALGFSWIKVLLDVPRRAVHPLRHLFLLDLLDVDMDEALGNEAPSGRTAAPTGRHRRGRPVEDGPCRSPACERFDPDLLPPPARSGGQSLVYVRCPYCRFHYFYRADEPARWQILEAGAAWEAHVRALDRTRSGTWEEVARELGMSATMLAYRRKKLGLMSPGTAHRHRLGPTPGGRRRVATRRAAYRAWLLDARRAHPGWRRTELRQADLTKYAWLLSRDRDWAERHLPRRKPLRRTSPVDWVALDDALVRTVPAAAKRAVLTQTRPRWLAQRAILKHLTTRKVGWYQLQRLPRTARALQAAIAKHNGPEYWQRRLAWAEAECVEHHVLPSPSRMAREIGFDSLERAAQAGIDIGEVRHRVGDAIKRAVAVAPHGRPPEPPVGGAP